MPEHFYCLSIFLSCLGAFLSLKMQIGNQGQQLMSEALFNGNCFTEREDLYAKAVFFLLQFDI